MSPTNKETADLIRRVSGITSSVIPPQSAMPQGGQQGGQQYSVPAYNPEILRKETKEGQDFASQVAQGGMNAIGYVFRVITGLGRGVTNLAGGVLPHANAIWDTYKDGFQVEDIGKTVEEGSKGLVAGVGGLLKGVAISGIPQLEKVFEEGDGRELYEFGSDLFKSEDFSKAMQNLREAGAPVGNLGTEKANEKLFNIGTPFGDIGLSENEAWGLGWDILTDPTTYATLGIMGAVKGASRGISTATTFAKAGKPANFADVAPKALPRPFYTAQKGGKKVPLANPTYTIQNTSPLTYIAKEMGRGFMEAHRSRLNQVKTRASIVGSIHALNEGFTKNLYEKGEGITDEYIEEILAVNRDQILMNQREELAKQGVTDPMEQERILAQTSAALEEQMKRISGDKPIWRGLFGEEGSSALAKLAEEKGITPIQEGAFQIADRYARGLRRTAPAVPVNKPERFNSEATLSFSRAMESASNPKTGSGEFGSLWDGIKQTDKATIKRAFDAMVRPIGYREQPAIQAKGKAETEATQNQDIIEAMYGTGLNPMGSKNRAPVQDMKAVDQAIPGTGKTRRVWMNKSSKELKQLMKEVRRAKDVRQGAGSALTAGKKTTIATESDILNAPLEFLTNLSKNYYEDVVMATAKSAKPWDKLTTSQKAGVTAQILEDPTVITADIFNKSMVLPTVMAARLGYIAEREVVQTTKEFQKISWFKDKKYNPLTAQVTHPKLHELAYSQGEIAEKGFPFSEATRLMLAAAGRIQDKDLNKTLRRLNVRLDSLYEGGDLMNLDRISEVLEEAHVAVIAKRSKDFRLKLKIENTGELGAENLVDPKLLNADPEALLGQHIADLTAKGTIATEEEILEAITKLDLIQVAQKEAGEKLTALGFDWMGIGKPGFLVLSRLESPTVMGRKASSTEAKTFGEIKRIIKGPEVKPTTAVTRQEAFESIVKQLQEIEARPTTTQATKDAINKIIRITIETPDGKRLAQTAKIDPETLGGYFSRIGNVLRQLEDRVQTGAVVGFDTVFARKGGEYDQQAFLPFLDEAYRASRLQDSLDGGYFANKIDEMLRAKNKNAKPLFEQTPAERSQSLKSLGQWNGAGISAGLLHTIIRSTEKQVQKGKKVELPEAVVEDIQRSYDAVYNKMIDDILREDRATFEAEKRASDVVTEDTGTGNMKRVILENLSEQERAVYKELISQNMLTVDPDGQVLAMIKKLYDDYKFYQANAQQKLPDGSLTAPKVWRNGKWITPKSTADILPGDEISYAQFTKLSLDLQKREKKSPELVAIQQSAKQLSWRGIRNAEKRAGDRIARMRAEAEIFSRFPKFADSGTMIRKAQSIGNTAKASVNWRARLWLASLVDEGDRGIRALEAQNSVMKRLQNKLVKGVDALSQERKEFTAILGKIETKLKKEYAATKLDVTKLTPREVLVQGNPLDLIRKIKGMKVLTSEDEELWDDAMTLLLEMQITGKGGRYASFSEMARTYKTAGRTFKPGDINPATGQQIPTDKEILDVLVGLGGTVGAKAAEFIKDPKVKRTTVVNLLRRLDKEIAKEDVANAQALDFIRATNVAGGEEVAKFAERLPENKVVQEEILNQLTVERMKLYDEGLDFIDYLVSVSLGKSNQQFFMNKAKNLQIAEQDSLGRNIDVDSPSFTAKRTAQKGTYETTRILYTGWKSTITALSNMAKEKGLEGAARQQFMTQNAMRVLRVRDLALHAQGIFPSSTLELKLNEARILGLNVFSPDEVARISKPVYLTDADVLDIFPPDAIGDYFFRGTNKDMPVTSLTPAARLLVSALDILPVGAYFDDAQRIALGNKMIYLMRNATQKTSPIKGKNGQKGLSHYDIDPDLYETRFAEIAAWMLDQGSALKLFEQHVINAAVATKVYKYQSGEVTKEITRAMLKMLSSPFASTGTKIQSIIDASDAIRGLTGRKDLSPEVLLQADLDLNTALASQLDLDSIHVARQALKLEEAANTPAAQKRLAGQRKSTSKRFLPKPTDEGDFVKRVNQIRLELDKARQEGGLYNNLAALRNLEEVKKGATLEKDDPFDVFDDHQISDVQIRRSLKFADGALGRLFYDYGMQTLRTLYGPVERRRVDAVSTFEVIAGNMNKKWQDAYPGRNILGDAFKIIQQVPDEVLDKALAARATLFSAAANKKKSAEATLTPDEYAELMDDSKTLDEYLRLDDQALNEAVNELWTLSGRIFGGGEKSMINLDGITPKWLNTNLREVGGGNRVGFIDENGNYSQVKDGYGFTSKESMGEIWREWDITNPVEMIVTLNTALERAHVIPSIADSAVKNFGVPKSNYATIADAKADGLVAIKTIPSLQKGKELVHFMDTENHYFPIQIAQELQAFSKLVSEIKYIQSKGVAEKALQKFNSLTNITKQVMTIWTLKNYIQNWIGGIFFNGYGGVISPFAYARAAKMLSTSGRNVKDIDMSALEVQMSRYEALKGQEGFVIKEVSDPRKSETMQITVNGKKVAISYGDLEKLANKYGLYVPVAQSREYDLVDEFGNVTTLSKAKTVLQKIRAAYDKPTFWLSKRAAERDNILRGAMWVDEMSKNNWTSLEAGAREAMKKVDRYHPQVQDLSTFNQKYSRTFVMFFTWRAKALGTVLGDLLDRPGPIVNTLRAQQAMMNSQEETQTDVFGNMTPTSAPLPSYFKHNLDPVAVDPETGLMTKFSVANPVTDLLGSAGWLSGIDFNSYEPLPDQIVDMNLDLMNRLVWQSAPFILKELINLPQGKTSSGSTDLTKGGWNASADAPAAVQDAMSSLGFGVFHTMFAAHFGGVFLNARMKNMNEDQRMAEAQRAFNNWLYGLKVTPLDTIENRQRGWQEMIEKIKTVKEIP